MFVRYVSAFVFLHRQVWGWASFLSANTKNNPVGKAMVATNRIAKRQVESTRTPTSLGMGLMDSLSSFLKNRDGDFVKLDSSSDVFGPGPVLVCFGIPYGIDEEEILDMIADGAPLASQQKPKVIRLSLTDDTVLDQTVQEALQGFVDGSLREATAAAATTTIEVPEALLDVPVLFFSGFQNSEMLQVYNILGREIYEETGGQAAAACAKAVPNAMNKSLRQVLTEISGDHKDAMAMETSPEED